MGVVAVTTVGAVMCWFDEEPSFLARAVRTAAAAGISSLVAVDGAYAAYRCEQPWSRFDQYDAIRDACADTGLPSLIPLVAEAWPTEMAKRDRSFLLTQEFAPDWLLLLDADFELRVERPLPDVLASVREDAADVRLLTPPGPNGSARYGPMPDARERLLVRAVPGLRTAGNHFTYVTSSGARLRGNPAQAPLEPAADVSADVTILHWTYHRPPGRVAAQFAYYQERDRLGVEIGLCVRCRERRAAFGVPADLKDLGAGGVEWGWAEVCPGCEPAARRAAIREGVRLGVDATTIAGHVRPLTVTG